MYTFIIFMSAIYPKNFSKFNCFPPYQPVVSRLIKKILKNIGIIWIFCTKFRKGTDKTYVTVKVNKFLPFLSICPQLFCTTDVQSQQVFAQNIHNNSTLFKFLYIALMFTSSSHEKNLAQVPIPLKTKLEYVHFYELGVNFQGSLSNF